MTVFDHPWLALAIAWATAIVIIGPFVWALCRIASEADAEEADEEEANSDYDKPRVITRMWGPEA